MQAGKKYYLYFSTMQKYTDFFDFLVKSNVEENYIDVVSMLWKAYSIGALLRSAYFEVIRIGDGKFTLNVQKYANDTYSIKLIVDPNYANVLERFTHE